MTQVECLPGQEQSHVALHSDVKHSAILTRKSHMLALLVKHHLELVHHQDYIDYQLHAIEQWDSRLLLNHRY